MGNGEQGTGNGEWGMGSFAQGMTTRFKRGLGLGCGV